MTLVFAAVATTLQGSGIVATYDPAGTQSPDLTTLCGSDSVCWIGTETFDSWNGSAPFTTTYPTTQSTVGVTTGGISGTYTGALTRSNNYEYGGAGGSGYYPTVSNSSYTLTLTASGGVPGVNYFGLWFSALDAGNELQFYEDGTLVYTFTPAIFQSLVGACPAASNPFCGNPNNGDDKGEQFAFLNFFDVGGYFDEVVFTETTSAGFESDNHTVGYMSPITPSGTVIPDAGSAPEPRPLLLLSLGSLMLIGLRRRSAHAR